MLSRVVQIKSAVIAAVALLRSDLSLNDHDWEVIEATLPILKIFAEVTEEISAEKNVSLSKIIPLCRLIITNVSNNSQQINELSKTEIIDMLATLERESERRFGFMEKHNILYAQATILDPRFKNRGFKDPRHFERAVNQLKTRVSEPQANEVSKGRNAKLVDIKKYCVRCPHDKERVVLLDYSKPARKRIFSRQTFPRKRLPL